MGKLLKQSGVQDGTLAQIVTEVVTALSGKVKNGVVLDDDSAASNGTDVIVVIAPNGVDAYLESTLANNASVLCDVGNNGTNGPKIPIFDNNSPGAVVLYFDEDATDPEKRFLVINPFGCDVFVPLTDGTKLRIAHDASAASNGVAVHCDDNAAVLYNRLLFVSPTNTSGTFHTTNAAPTLDAVWPTVVDGKTNTVETGGD